LLLFLVSHLELLSDVLLPKGIEDDLSRDFRHISHVKRPPLIMDNEGLLINYLTKGAKTVHGFDRNSSTFAKMAPPWNHSPHSRKWLANWEGVVL
jgi:hypothetical protein